MKHKCNLYDFLGKKWMSKISTGKPMGKYLNSSVTSTIAALL